MSYDKHQEVNKLIGRSHEMMPIHITEDQRDAVMRDIIRKAFKDLGTRAENMNEGSKLRDAAHYFGSSFFDKYKITGNSNDAKAWKEATDGAKLLSLA